MYTQKKAFVQRLKSRFVWLILGIILIVLTGCAPVPPGPTATPTRTPKPTLTPTPIATDTPSPTPTPAFPLSVGCNADVPDVACATLEAYVATVPQYFTWVDNVDLARVRLTTTDMSGAQEVGTWVYALAAPFYTVEDGTTLFDLYNTWQGMPGGSMDSRTLVVTQDTYDAFTTLWGPAGTVTVRTVADDNVLIASTEQQAWSLLPFDALHDRWKIITVDGYDPVDAIDQIAAGPLSIPIYLWSDGRADAQQMINDANLDFSNRDPNLMTRVMMTGVTAMTRATAQLMDTKGITYPAISIKAWFEDADFVHISNEVSFKPDCVTQGTGTMSFCSNDSYIALLEEINTNIIELTGNHLEDKGNQWVDHTLELYAARGWQWFGGGRNAEEGAQPLLIEHNGNKLAFLGCNDVGPYADADSGGAAPCYDYTAMQATITDLVQQGYQPIVAIQHYENYSPELDQYFYEPTDQQVRDFRGVAEAGAVYVQGSQAHQAQTLEFHGDTFIHYGLGNFFFDQMWSDGTRQEFVNQLTFYNGKLINIELKTAIMEEYGRPRPMTIGDSDPAADRAKFLEMIFSLSPDNQ